jgi:hypothetical protein
MYRKNISGQVLGFCLVNATTGAALTGATVTVYRVIDGGAQATATGTVSEEGNGQYSLALSQADTNGNWISLMFVATNAVPVEKTIVTTAADPTAATNFGITALPAVASGAAGAVITSGTGTAQLSVSAGLVTLAGVTHTGAVIPTVTTTTTATNVTTVNGLAAGVITAASIATGAITAAKFAAGAIDAAAIANAAIDAATFAAGAIDATAFAQAAADKVWSTTARVLTAGTNIALAKGTGVTGFNDPTAVAVADAVWDEDATAHQTQGTFGQAIGDPVADTDSIWGLTNANLDVAVSTRSTYAGGAVASVTARVAANTDQIAGSAAAATNLANQALALSSGSVNDAAATTTGFVGNSGLSAADDRYNGQILAFTSGTQAGIARRISDYVGATRTFAFAVAWPAAPGNTDAFVILGFQS